MKIIILRAKEHTGLVPSFEMYSIENRFQGSREMVLNTEHFKITVALWEKIFISTSGIMDLMTSTLNFKTNCFTRDKERHFIMIKRLIHQKNITIINMYE